MLVRTAQERTWTMKSATTDMLADGFAVAPVSAHAIALEQIVERGAGHSQQLGGPGDIAVYYKECLPDRLSLRARAHFLEVEQRGAVQRLRQAEVLGADHRGLTHYYCSLH